MRTEEALMVGRILGLGEPDMIKKLGVYPESCRCYDSSFWREKMRAKNSRGYDFSSFFPLDCALMGISRLFSERTKGNHSKIAERQILFCREILDLFLLLFMLACSAF